MREFLFGLNYLRDMSSLQKATLINQCCVLGVSLWYRLEIWITNGRKCSLVAPIVPQMVDEKCCGSKTSKDTSGANTDQLKHCVHLQRVRQKGAGEYGL